MILSQSVGMVAMEFGGGVKGINVEMIVWRHLTTILRGESILGTRRTNQLTYRSHKHLDVLYLGRLLSPFVVSSPFFLSYQFLNLKWSHWPKANWIFGQQGCCLRGSRVPMVLFLRIRQVTLIVGIILGIYHGHQRNLNLILGKLVRCVKQTDTNVERTCSPPQWQRFSSIWSTLEIKLTRFISSTSICAAMFWLSCVNLSICCSCLPATSLAERRHPHISLCCSL